MQTAGMHLRASSSFQNNLANGNYSGLAATLNTLNYVKSATVNTSLPDIPAGVNGQVLRNSGLFPENFIVTNPQFTAVNMVAAMGSNNYHSMEAQVTMRPTHGLGLQATYTWSRNNGTGKLSQTLPTGTPTTPFSETRARTTFARMVRSLCPSDRINSCLLTVRAFSHASSRDGMPAGS